MSRQAVATLLAAVSAAAPCTAPLAQDEADVGPFHWAYAAMFGTGVYRLDDGTETRVVRLPVSKVLREPRATNGRAVGVRLLFPITVGVQNLDDDDLPPERVTDRVEHAAFLPGVELEFPGGERWTVRARGQLGWGTEIESEENSAGLLALGARSRFEFVDAAGHPALINGVLWAGFDPDTGEERSLLRLTQAIEFDVRVPRWQFRGETMHFLPHVLGDWYYRPADQLALGEGGFEHVYSEWQIGLAAGREQGFKLLRFEFDSVGIAYRFSDQSAGIRFYMNSVF